MRRREFITLLGGAAAAWPLAARAQQAERVRRIGVLMYLAADDAEGQARLAAFTQALKQLGWSDGRNLRIDTRWATADDIRRHAAELAALAPDVLVAGTGTATVAPLLQATRTVPIVFVTVIDPVGAGFVDEPGTAGRQRDRVHDLRIQHERKMAGAAQRDRAPRDAGGSPSRSGRRLRDRAVRRCPDRGAVVGGGVEPGRRARCRRNRARRHGIRKRDSNGGLIVTGSALAVVHRELITTLAARHKLPAVYPGRYYVTAGGLISYGPDLVDQYRRAAGYVDRILKGEKPADLPVQAPTKYELVINLKTAKALGLTCPAAAARAAPTR